MMDELPIGPDEKESISDDAIAEVRKHLDVLAQAIGLGDYVHKRRTRRKAATAQAEEGRE